MLAVVTRRQQLPVNFSDHNSSYSNHYLVLLCFIIQTDSGFELRFGYFTNKEDVTSHVYHALTVLTLQ